MGKPTGFLDYKRENDLEIAPKERIQNFNEFHIPLSLEKQRLQGARCMACGVPFCQAGMMIGGMASGCPLNNLVPECNDLVYHGNWEEAYRRLTKTHCFPEFTSRVCPALCEAACTCNLNGDPVTTKANERAIIENAYATGLVKACPPEVRTGKKVAVVGSGRSGLATALQLNKRGHKVTVFERNDRIGGLLRYGIPNMKLDKKVIDRRQALMQEEGIEFVTNANIGENVRADDLLKEYELAVKKRAEHIPLQYIVGETEFMGLKFKVNSNVLIPRQDTETLVEEALKKVKPGMKVLDMCTGSGCIIISILHNVEGVKGYAVDISKQAVNVAKENAKLNEVPVLFERSDLFEMVTEKFDVIVSNPPYIPTDVIPQLMPEVQVFEPVEALDGKEDGLYFYRKIVEQSRDYLNPGGYLMFEIGYDQGKDVSEMMTDAGFSDVCVKKDLAGNDRVVTGML